ncbi:type I restriction enzyme, S subunit [Bacteroidales bacterium KHT7]|nr:type I restriction enzyme, S subunit [Bacteroidales bacterium KHT7]
MKEGWKYMKLGEISESIKDGDWIEKKDQSLSGFRLIQTGNIGVGLFKNKAESARYISEETFSRLHCEEVFEGDILISRLPDPVGRACIVPYLDTRNITAVDCSIVKLNSKIINSDYFLLYTQSNKYFNQISSLCTGSTRQRITRKKLTELQIPVPPLPDQQRIVSYLDAEFVKIEALKANAEKQLQAAKDLFQAALKEMLTPKEGWVEKKLKEVGKTQTGSTPSKSNANYYGNYIPFIRPAELNFNNNGEIKYDSEVKLSESGANCSRVIDENSVLMCCIGSIGKIGFTTLKVTCNQQINTITPCSDYNARFIYYALLSPDFQEEAIKIANSARATLAIISKGKWENIFIPIPPRKEQQRIADRLDALSANVKALQTNYAETITLCNDLKQALLKKVFG